MVIIITQKALLNINEILKAVTSQIVGSGSEFIPKSNKAKKKKMQKAEHGNPGVLVDFKKKKFKFNKKTLQRMAQILEQRNIQMEQTA